VLNITTLWCGVPSPGDRLRYGVGGAPVHRRPVVVWNLTQRCNLFCAHCYASARSRPLPGELAGEEALRIVDELADYEVPVLLLSGGEPLLHPDVLGIAQRAAARGITVGLSTNGTLLDEGWARALREAGVSNVGVSLDGLEEANDRFRGKRGAFRAALDGVRAAVRVGFRTSLRLTMTRYTVDDLEALFDLAEAEGVERLCFYHLAYAGRGERIVSRAGLPPDRTRAAVDRILDATERRLARGVRLEVLTVDNHADAVSLVLRAARERPERLPRLLSLLLRNGGNSSGVGIGCIGPTGEVHPDAFSRMVSFGNVRERPFAAIWSDTRHPVMAGLKRRPRPLRGRCGSCPALPLCNGNLRARAAAVSGDFWGPDPACYLSDEELEEVGGVLARFRRPPNPPDLSTAPASG